MKFYQNWTAEVRDGEGKCHTFPASVPGNIQKDFANYMGYDDLMFANNVAVLEKTESYIWTYITYPEYKAEKGEKVYFVSEGIDYIFEIRLDGRSLYSSEGMYTPVKIDITDMIGDNSKLEVVIYPHPKNGNIKRDRSEAADTCKPPHCYGWDWNPRLLVSGMHMPAYIETAGEGKIESCELFYELDSEKRSAEITFVCESVEEPIFTLYDADDNVVLCGKDNNFILNDVNLWWCSGLGSAYLYKWTAKTSDDIKTGYIGFRNVKLVQNSGTEHGPEGGFPKGQYAAPITVELNGVRVFAKGSNFVNISLFPGNVTEKDCEFIVKSLKEANMNIVRMWGGSGICKDKFYDLCDKYGIMVWQEFMLACNLYSDDEKYLNVLRREAVSIVRRLRKHPSLIFYCGGNELFNDWSGMTEQSHALRLLNSVCFEEDRKRPFLFTSPVSDMAHGGYVFRDDEGQEIFRQFQKSRKTAYTEFGCPSIAKPELLKKIIPENELSAISPTENWTVHHAFGSWGEKRWACLDVIEYYFGKGHNVEDLVMYSEKLQSFGYKACFEEARRQWGHCSMVLNWCLNEPWICAANNSLISYPDVKKPAYYAVRDALRPVMASARIPQYSYTSFDKMEFEVWYHNETLKTVSDTVRVKVVLGDKTVYSGGWETGEVAPMSVKKGLSVSFDLPDHEKKEFLKILLETQHPDNSNEYEVLFETYTSKGRMMNT